MDKTTMACCENCLLRTHQVPVEDEEESIRTKCQNWLDDSENQTYASSFSVYSEVQKSDVASSNEALYSIDRAHAAPQKECTNFGDINIHKSKKIHVGNVTYLTGPVCFNQTVSLSKKEKRTFLKEFTDQLDTLQILDRNGVVVHLNQTIHVGGKSWKKILSNCLFRFMELCMQVFEGA